MKIAGPLRLSPHCKRTINFREPVWCGVDMVPEDDLKQEADHKGGKVYDSAVWEVGGSLGNREKKINLQHNRSCYVGTPSWVNPRIQRRKKDCLGGKGGKGGAAQPRGDNLAT